MLVPIAADVPEQQASCKHRYVGCSGFLCSLTETIKQLHKHLFNFYACSEMLLQLFVFFRYWKIWCAFLSELFIFLMVLEFSFPFTFFSSDHRGSHCSCSCSSLKWETDPELNLPGTPPPECPTVWAACSSQELRTVWQPPRTHHTVCRIKTGLLLCTRTDLQQNTNAWDVFFSRQERDRQVITGRSSRRHRMTELLQTVVLQWKQHTKGPLVERE